MIKSALIMAGGMGTRMGLLTKNNPKCLLKIGKYTILSHLYSQLRILKISKIIIATGFFYKKIRKYSKFKLQKDSDHILKILGKNKSKFSYPEVLISNSGLNHSTSQRMLVAKQKINDEDFLYLYGDTLLKPNFSSLFSNYFKNKFLGVITISNPFSNFGIVKIKKNLVFKFEEKKKMENIWVNSGWMILNKKIFSYLKSSESNFEDYLFKKLIKLKKLGYFKNKSLYIPIDKVNDIKLANKAFNQNKNSWY